MSEPTKACNLTADEIKGLIGRYGIELNVKHNDAIVERINYLNKRLKTFNDPVGEAVASTANAAGWGTNNG